MTTPESSPEVLVAEVVDLGEYELLARIVRCADMGMPQPTPTLAAKVLEYTGGDFAATTPLGFDD